MVLGVGAFKAPSLWAAEWGRATWHQVGRGLAQPRAQMSGGAGGAAAVQSLIGSSAIPLPLEASTPPLTAP